jgi:hypothetical protein
MIGAVFVTLFVFANEQRKGAMKALMILALGTTVALFALNITGLIGYTDYRLTAPDSPKSVILGLNPFVHEVYFSTMEYLSIPGPIWATMITWLIWHYKEQIFTNTALKNTMRVLVTLAVSYAIVIAFSGIVPTRLEAVH